MEPIWETNVLSNDAEHIDVRLLCPRSKGVSGQFWDHPTNSKFCPQISVHRHRYSVSNLWESKIGDNSMILIQEDIALIEDDESTCTNEGHQRTICRSPWTMFISSLWRCTSPSAISITCWQDQTMKSRSNLSNVNAPGHIYDVHPDHGCIVSRFGSYGWKYMVRPDRVAPIFGIHRS
jgi:hypothetical protein